MTNNLYYKFRYALGFYKKKLTEFYDDHFWKMNDNNQVIDSKHHLDLVKDKYIGKRCFVVGNGPSLNEMDLNLMKDDYVFVSNSFFLKFDELGFIPQFITVEDHLVAEDNQSEFLDLKRIQKYYPFDLRKTLFKDENSIYVNMHRATIHHSSPEFPLFSHDCSENIYWGGTVLYMSLQLAAHMGLSEVYLIGVDLTYKIPKDILLKGSVLTSQSDDPNHFDAKYFGKGKRWHLPEVDRMQKAFDHAYEAMGRKGIKLYNATLGGNLVNIPRKEFNELFK